MALAGGCQSATCALAKCQGKLPATASLIQHVQGRKLRPVAPAHSTLLEGDDLPL